MIELKWRKSSLSATHKLSWLLLRGVPLFKSRFEVGSSHRNATSRSMSGDPSCFIQHTSTASYLLCKLPPVPKLHRRPSSFLLSSVNVSCQQGWSRRPFSSQSSALTTRLSMNYHMKGVVSQAIDTICRERGRVWSHCNYQVAAEENSYCTAWLGMTYLLSYNCCVRTPQSCAATTVRSDLSGQHSAMVTT